MFLAQPPANTHKHTVIIPQITAVVLNPQSQWQKTVSTEVLTATAAAATSDKGPKFRPSAQ